MLKSRLETFIFNLNHEFAKLYIWVQILSASRFTFLPAKLLTFHDSLVFNGSFHWNRLCNQLYDSRVGCKTWGIGDKNHKKCLKILDQLHLPDKMYHMLAWLDPHSNLTWSQDHFLNDKMEKYHHKP